MDRVASWNPWIDILGYFGKSPDAVNGERGYVA
jgi:hypothetical protein